MINLAATLTLLLAQASTDQARQKKLTPVTPSDVSREVNKGIQHDIPWELLLIGLGTTLIVIVVISLKRWWQHRMIDPSPMVLYSAIARKAGLTWSDRFVLWRIARRFDLPTPIALLLSRGTMRHYTGVYLSNRSGMSRQKLVDRFARIESELFE